MESMKKEHKKIQNTRNILLNTLIELSESRPMEEISVSELCRAAHINRTTFYKYYSVPSDIIDHKLAEIMGICFSPELLSSAPGTGNLYQTMLHTCQIYYDQRHLVQLYKQAGPRMLSALQHHFSNALPQALPEYSSVCFISGGVASIIFQWSQQNYRQTPEEIAHLLTGLIVKIQG